MKFVFPCELILNKFVWIKKIRQMEASHDLVYVWLNKLDVDGQKKIKFAFCFTLHCHFYHFSSIREHVNLNFALESYWYQANWIIWFKHNRSKVMNVNAASFLCCFSLCFSRNLCGIALIWCKRIGQLRKSFRKYVRYAFLQATS